MLNINQHRSVLDGSELGFSTFLLKSLESLLPLLDSWPNFLSSKLRSYFSSSLSYNDWEQFCLHSSLWVQSSQKHNLPRWKTPVCAGDYLKLWKISHAQWKSDYTYRFGSVSENCWKDNQQNQIIGSFYAALYALYNICTILVQASSSVP